MTATATTIEPISQLPVAASLSGAELAPVVQTGETVRTTAQAIANLAPAATPGVNNVGYLNLPQNIQEANYQFTLSDVGKHVYHKTASTPTYTVPTNATIAFQIGAAITVASGPAGTGNITVTPAGGVTLRQAGTTNTGNRTIAANAMVTLLKVDIDDWLINGAGLS